MKERNIIVYFKLRSILVAFIFLNFLFSCRSTIYLVRHAEKLPGSTNPSLTEEGLQRARVLADSMRNKHIAKVFTTDSNRTRETARFTASQFNLPFTFYRKDSLGQLVESLKKNLGSNMLVVAHSEIIQEILSKFGLTLNRPISGYSRMIIISRRKILFMQTSKVELTYGVPD